MDELRQYIEDRYTAGEFIERIGISIEELMDIVWDDLAEWAVHGFRHELTFDGDLSD